MEKVSYERVKSFIQEYDATPNGKRLGQAFIDRFFPGQANLAMDLYNEESYFAAKNIIFIVHTEF